MNRLSAPRYDLFKLLVAIVLLIILILMLLGGSATTPAATLPSENGSSPVPSESPASPFASETTIVTRPAATGSPSPAPSTTLPAESSPIPDAATSTPITTPTSEPPSTATGNVDSSGTPVSGQSISCNTRMPSRLSVGQAARVVQRLNLRRDPSIDAPIVQTNAVGTVVEIVGGPVCTPVGDRAYIWWQIRLSGGAEGWSAEAQLNEPAYLLQPIQ